MEYVVEIERCSVHPKMGTIDCSYNDGLHGVQNDKKKMDNVSNIWSWEIEMSPFSLG